MFITNERIVPRSKEWVPLATQQIRLRNLIQVLAFNLDKSDKGDKSDKKGACPLFSFTLHCTTMSAPFYASEKQESESPKWKEFDGMWRESSLGATDALIVRLWSHDGSEDREISVWGVHLSGLTYLGPHLGVDTPALKPTSLVFRMVGGFFTAPTCIEAEPMFRFVSVNTNPTDLHNSYTVNVLLRLRTLQQAIKKQMTAAETLKQKISTGDFFTSETRERSMLRRLLNKTKPKVNQCELLKLKEVVEEQKFRVQLLKQEKTGMAARLRALRECVDTQADANQMQESSIMEHYRVLRREVQAHRDWKRGHIERREAQLHSRALLNFRSKQLIAELNLIYPIEESATDRFTICGVHLPDSEDFNGHDETQIAVALGFVTHVVQMMSCFLQVPLRYPVLHLGSRSRIVDHISEKIPETEREFPLHSRSKDKLQFHYAVYLLNKNIAQLRWLYGLPTQDLRSTLANIFAMVKLKSGFTNLDYATRSLSSSTADLFGSSLSISSPIGSVLSAPPKRAARPHRLSESDTPERGPTPLGRLHIHRHRVSKSAGSAKDFDFCEASEFLLKTEPSSNDVTLGHSLSFSLDKGLDEMTKSSELHSAGGLLTLASEVLLETQINADSIPRISEAQLFDEKFSTEEISLPKDQSNSAKAEEIELSKSSNEEQIMEATEELMKHLQESSNRTESDATEHPKQESTEENITPTSLKSDAEPCSVRVTDELLDDVTTRAEILANQTTSFNRFRSRFKSTLEPSNA